MLRNAMLEKSARVGGIAKEMFSANSRIRETVESVGSQAQMHQRDGQTEREREGARESERERARLERSSHEHGNVQAGNRPARMMTLVVPSPTSSSWALDSSIMLLAAGCLTSISRRIACPSLVMTAQQAED